MRFTKPRDVSIEGFGHYDVCSKNLFEPMDKLGQLEDIEEELGIDLLTLFKALKNGIFAKEYTNNIDLYEVRGIEQNSLSIISKICSSADCDGIRYFKDYGKTWALTEDELK